MTVDSVPIWGGIGVFMHSDEGPWGGRGIADLSETVEDSEVEWVVEVALDAMQDDVALASHGIAWPRDSTAVDPLPRPWAKVTNDVLSFGYGSLMLGSGIALDEIAA